MNPLLILLDSLEQWAPYYRSESVTTADRYLLEDQYSQQQHQVINLCSNLGYQSEGYYCSLLAQARKHKILPSIETLNRLDNNVLSRLDHMITRHCSCAQHFAEDPESGGYRLDLYFGKCEDARLTRFARAIFDLYPAPLLRVSFSSAHPFQVTRIRNLTLDELDDHQQNLFAENLDRFNKRVWRKPRSRKPFRYDLAILHNPDESFPPSNKGAIKLFVSEARKMDINAELITEEESGRVMEFDGLFIRQTTAVNNITYRLAQLAEQAEMVVLDDPSSIIRCTNKVYLKELLEHNGVPAPRSRLIFRKNPLAYGELARDLGETMVLKIPDGSFSVGVDRISSEDEYREKLTGLLQRTSVLLVQEYIPTQFDWRIGMLNGECIYACKYFMARGHWQIYRHATGRRTRSGGVETVPVHTVPRKVIRAATRATAPIGRGLYGVDIKVRETEPVVIEVNDNPSIDHGVEDLILGPELYRSILREITRRLEARRRV